MKDDSSDTKNETEKRILSFFLIGQSFLKIFAGAGAKLAGRRLALKENSVQEFTPHKSLLRITMNVFTR